MRPIPIDEATAAALGGGHLAVLAGPDGDLTSTDVAPLEVLLQKSDEGFLLSSSVWLLEDGDLITLAAGGRIVLTVHGHQPVVSLGVVPEPR